MACGLCCDGTLFGSVVVQQDERERLRRVGLRVVEQDGTFAINQRCAKLAGCLCAIYAERPAACARYECTLRKRVVAGATTEAAGRADIARMRMLLAKLGESFGVPASADVSVWEALLALEEATALPADAEARRRQDAGLDALTELLALGRSTFEPEFSGGS